MTVARGSVGFSICITLTVQHRAICNRGGKAHSYKPYSRYTMLTNSSLVYCFKELSAYNLDHNFDVLILQVDPSPVHRESCKNASPLEKFH
ncbi:hypothetical protein K493DRAFT_89927 [Basidiobolus meristosporus CBS 931.73]|uniref:Uncharacterized protein n=1 Tax=Basidiobolus meristosporus CBS 931.73 TaxID=1314790 RepID=A0A1Y1YUQ1_9FUNG|nr:hypothetical protein K493DRAFT_89927 [Basidiobolus meristosporus CBS 931.73]|eukprot:ORY01772.1 hypothetical protein K493DRAFT_89927 [Basidiobolus meristosporus CBS 931.73]